MGFLAFAGSANLAFARHNQSTFSHTQYGTIARNVFKSQIKEKTPAVNCASCPGTDRMIKNQAVCTWRAMG